MDRKFIFTALLYAVLGMLLGIIMAASKKHDQVPTHAHIMLVGFVVSFIYALCHKLWLNNLTSLLAKAQFYIHPAGAVLMVTGLFLLYGKLINVEALEPVLSVSSLLVLLGMILMLVLFFRVDQSP